MSIYSTIWSADGGEHANNCNRWSPPVKSGPHSWTSVLDDARPCDCGQPGSPVVYQGSHVLPSAESERAGVVSVAMIQSHITRDGRDDGPDEGQPWPWLRVSVGQEAAVLDEEQVRGLWDALGGWLEARASSGDAAPTRRCG